MNANDRVHGLTVRDYIAIEAMNGLFVDMTEDDEYTPSDLAQQSYEIADAMIK